LNHCIGAVLPFLFPFFYPFLSPMSIFAFSTCLILRSFLAIQSAKSLNIDSGDGIGTIISPSDSSGSASRRNGARPFWPFLILIPG